MNTDEAIDNAVRLLREAEDQTDRQLTDLWGQLADVWTALAVVLNERDIHLKESS